MNARYVFDTSEGSITLRYYRALLKLGPKGIIAKHLFRAQKCSHRAKKYGMTEYRGMAYDNKAQSLQELCAALNQHAEQLGMRWGWKTDPLERYATWVLYVELPQGQVSFHSPTKYEGPAYPGDWDGKKLSGPRILDFCDSVMSPEAIPVQPKRKAVPRFQCPLNFQ